MTPKLNAEKTLTLTLSRPTGEGTAVACFLVAGGLPANSALTFTPATENDSPSPIGWERAGVRAFWYYIVPI
jgi:hypothetical protein